MEINGNNGNNGSKRLYTSGQVIEIVGISNRQLYYWELKGLIKPEEVTIGSRRFKKYSESDIYLLKKVKEYLEIGYTLEAAFKKMEPLISRVNNSKAENYKNGAGVNGIRVSNIY